MSFEVILKLRFNHEQDSYSIIQAGYKYVFPAVMLDDFKKFIIENHLVSGWYRMNPDKVIRTSAFD